MQDRCTFEYAIIRVVPKVEREEFINVGVILFSKQKKFLQMKTNVNENKLLALDPDIDLNLVKKYLKAWEDICAGSPKGGAIGEFDIADRFRWLSAAKSTIIQCSPTHPGLCGDPEKELEDAFKRYVL
ncbi:MAG: DUF3037 domain-containing protein [Schleiferiaceae bacterium]|jgi:hypothetical protein|nr:DUF3037 domain-containing protein [Schleiferiaceae bacterium]